MSIRILCLGDIVGRPGRQVVHQKLPALVRDRKGRTASESASERGHKEVEELLK